MVRPTPLRVLIENDVDMYDAGVAVPQAIRSVKFFCKKT